MGFSEIGLTGDVVYPGHPVVVALCVVSRFDSYEKAIEPMSKGTPRALGDLHIPGSGGCVYLALELLKRLRNGSSWEDSIQWADEAWARVDDQRSRDKGRWKKGQDQADGLKPRLLKFKAWWQK